MSHWIKVEITTPDKPEIVAAARICGTTEEAAFTAFFRLWVYFDSHTATGFLPGITIDDLDKRAGLKGFGRAMEQVGWIVQDARGISITNWNRHNGDSAKSRALNQKRMQRNRAKGQWK